MGRIRIDVVHVEGRAGMQNHYKQNAVVKYNAIHGQFMPDGINVPTTGNVMPHVRARHPGDTLLRVRLNVSAVIVATFTSSPDFNWWSEIDLAVGIYWDRSNLIGGGTVVPPPTNVSNADQANWLFRNQAVRRFEDRFQPGGGVDYEVASWQLTVQGDAESRRKGSAGVNSTVWATWAWLDYVNGLRINTNPDAFTSFFAGGLVSLDTVWGTASSVP